MQNRTGFSRQTVYARFYRHKGIMISTLFTSSKFVTNRNHFRSLQRLGRPASSTTTAWQMAAPLLSRRQRRIGLFGTCNALLCARVNHLNDTEYNHSLPLYSCVLIHCPLISTSLRMSSALWASARSLGSLMGKTYRQAPSPHPRCSMSAVVVHYIAISEHRR